MVSAEVRLDRMLQGGKEVKRAVNKYRKLLVETQAMKDKYTLGHYRTKAEYLMAVGHKVVRINEELRGTVEVATAENEVQEDIFEHMLEAEIMEQADRPRQLDFPAGLLWIQIALQIQTNRDVCQSPRKSWGPRRKHEKKEMCVLWKEVQRWPQTKKHCTKMY